MRRAAVDAVIEAVTDVGRRSTGRPRRSTTTTRASPVGPRPLIRQPDRAIDWSADSTAIAMRRIHAAEGHPGVLDAVAGIAFHLFGAHREDTLRGAPGEIVAQRHGAICRATVDGAVWISHLKRPGHFKLPAARALAVAGHELDVPELPTPLHAAPFAPRTFREIAYEERRGVGYLSFDFYNGAMSTDQCRRLLDAYRYARARETRVIVLIGGIDFFSNGIHLNVIEAADDPAAESWSNLKAIDDLVREVIETDSHLVVSALTGDAAAGGVPFALAADHVLAREDVVLNPYYRHMGGLYGSEYWTYLLPRRVGAEMTTELTSPPFEPRRNAARGRDRAARRRVRRDRRGVPGRRPAVCRAPGARRGQACSAGRQAPRAQPRRATQTARRLSRRRARAVARVFPRRRPQLPRGSTPVRPQAGQSLRL